MNLLSRYFCDSANLRLKIFPSVRRIKTTHSIMCKLMSRRVIGSGPRPSPFQLFPFHPIMATFYANPDDSNEPWIEQEAFGGFRKWHVMFFCFSGLTALVILVCCCVKFRIPRTKQEIEGDYRRKKLAEKFQERLRMLQNQDMDAMDLQQALKLIQEDFDQENAKILKNNASEGQAETNEDEDQPKFARKFADIMLATKLQSLPSGE